MKLFQNHQFLCIAYILTKGSLPHLVDHGMLCRTDQVDRCDPELLIIGSVKIHIQCSSGTGLPYMVKHGSFHCCHGKCRVLCGFLSGRCCHPDLLHPKVHAFISKDIIFRPEYFLDHIHITVFLTDVICMNLAVSRNQSFCSHLTGEGIDARHMADLLDLNLTFQCHTRNKECRSFLSHTDIFILIQDLCLQIRIQFLFAADTVFPVT